MLSKMNDMVIPDTYCWVDSESGATELVLHGSAKNREPTAPSQNLSHSSLATFSHEPLCKLRLWDAAMAQKGIIAQILIFWGIEG